LKIRIHDNSIRLRLNLDEVKQIGRLESVACVTQFPSGETFGYQLHASARGTEPTARFSDGCISVVLSEAQAKHWALTETEVSIVVSAPIPAGPLHLLIEKDFECLDPREGEDQATRFQNPKARLMEQQA
jgi:hypothetical protein